MALIINLSANLPLKALDVPLTPEELQLLSEACEAHPYICYPLLAAQTICLTLLVGKCVFQVAKDYGAPALTSCFSSCKSKKQLKQDPLLSRLYTEIDPNLSQGKQRKIIGMAVLKDKFPNISKKEHKALGALLKQYQWDPAAALAAAKRKKDPIAIRLLTQLK